MAKNKRQIKDEVETEEEVTSLEAETPKLPDTPEHPPEAPRRGMRRKLQLD